MDQPTYLDLRITGTEQDVTQAAVAAIRCTKQYHKPEYVEYFVNKLLGHDSNTSTDSEPSEFLFCDLCVLRPSTDTNPAEFTFRDLCNWAFDEFDVDEIADAVIQASSDVELHLSARITISWYDGYDTHVYINYVSGEKTMDVVYDEFDAEYKAQIRKILDAVGEEYAKKLADEMIPDQLGTEWTELYADIQEAFLDAALSYATTPDDFISQMREKANELFGIVIDDDKDEDKE